MEHRRFLAHPEAHHPFAGGGLLGRIGGHAAIAALIDGLYHRIETDPELRRLFNRDLANEREAQKRFFVEWLGGDTAYSDRAYLPLRTATICCPSRARLQRGGSRISATRSMRRWRTSRRGARSMIKSAFWP